ncbi:hypothetical protein [Paenibacillus sp. J2TS4]|uniref:hypothetical protein n=1 Tax=Paenibacillus sp. J2TS4 TaxID=2807194 RepID=UPI001B2CA43A|nr:hypothetical protein [Paenibacillus sp. J2TS4]GIP36151.1 hypothetical protein J2TS4_53610 [Paenibacillus sp. J2TS4]
MKMIGLLAGIGLAGTGLVFLLVYLLRSKSRSNVVKLSHYKRKSSRVKQKCSFCKTKSDSLTFYSSHEGKVVGVCRKCAVIAKRQDWMPI